MLVPPVCIVVEPSGHAMHAMPAGEYVPDEHSAHFVSDVGKHLVRTLPAAHVAAAAQSEQGAKPEVDHVPLMHARAGSQAKDRVFHSKSGMLQEHFV